MTWDLNAEAARVHAANEKWWRDLDTGEPIERDDGELFALMASELSEALEGERKNLDDDKLVQFKMAGVEMADFVIRILDYTGRRGIKLTDEIADARYRFPWVMVSSTSNRANLIWSMHRSLVNAFEYGKLMQSGQFSFLISDARLYCETFGYPFDAAYEAKMAYNAIRADHTHEARKLADGKKF